MAVQPLSDEDIQLIKDSIPTAQFRVFRTAIEHQYLKEAEALVTCQGSEQLFRHQGILLGLKKALAILSVQAMGEEKVVGTSRVSPEPSPIRPFPKRP